MYTVSAPTNMKTAVATSEREFVEAAYEERKRALGAYRFDDLPLALAPNSAQASPIDSRELDIWYRLDARVDHLYQAARASSGDLHADLHTVNFYLKRQPLVRLEFMRRLLQLIDVEGTYPQELDIFYAALHEIFPEVKDLRDEAI